MAEHLVKTLSTGIPGVDLLEGIHLVTGYRKTGRTAFLRELVAEASKQKLNVMYIGPEEDVPSLSEYKGAKGGTVIGLKMDGPGLRVSSVESELNIFLATFKQPIDVLLIDDFQNFASSTGPTYARLFAAAEQLYMLALNRHMVNVVSVPANRRGRPDLGARMTLTDLGEWDLVTKAQSVIQPMKLVGEYGRVIRVHKHHLIDRGLYEAP